METDLQNRLFSLADPIYREFQCRLMPTVPPERVIGVRTPVLRALAKEINGTPDAESLLSSPPHRFYEEYNLHGFLICLIRDFDLCVQETDRFLPFVDNWATCDLVSPAVFRKNPSRLLPHIKRWLASEDDFTVRFGLEMLMSFYLDDNFRPEYLELAASATGSGYYVRMMVAWFFATALAKQRESVLPYFTENRLAPWTHNKAIQKARESYRISKEDKEFLNGLKIKE